MEIPLRPKDNLRYELAKNKIDENFSRWLALPSTKIMVQKLLDDCKLESPQMTPPPALFSKYSPGSPISGSPKRPSLSPHTSSDRLSTTHVHLSQNDTFVQTRPSNSVKNLNNGSKVPQFYFPQGKPVDSALAEKNSRIINSVFLKESVRVNEFENLVSQLCGLPKFMKFKLFTAAGGGDSLSKTQFLRFWKKELENKSPVERFFFLVKKNGKSFIEREDFHFMMNVLMEIHPGLDFLKATPEFQDRYADSVIERIFYTVDLNDDGRISLRELKRSNFFQVCLILEEEEDINKIRDYFSYEHFYVLYCRFWEIDTDHDFIIDKDDFSRYEGHTLSRKANDRIFEQAPRKFTCKEKDKMGYDDFIWFMLSEEDKTSIRSLHYWFKVIDLDNNGIITPYEMEYFYEEQLRRLEYLNQEMVPFKDIVCQMTDMLNPKSKTQFTIEDFLAKKTISGIFFNALVNLNKFLNYEQRDPFSVKKEISDNPDFSDWDRFALNEYVRLAMEEENAENNQVLDEEWDSEND
jgi:serine/threonine-protein phosphatase 2A regulatory subunit B''